jgi:NADH:ubiquinone oxidoreductase subunit 2 (subunit N)
MAIAMFSFVGIGFTPPTIGFMGKYFLFKEAVKFDLIAVAVIAVLTSVVSAFYYLNVVVVMFMKKAEDGDSAALAGLREEKVGFMAGDAILRVLLTASAVLIFLLGFFPNLFIGITDNADAPDAPASAVSMVRK